MIKVFHKIIKMINIQLKIKIIHNHLKINKQINKFINKQINKLKIIRQFYRKMIIINQNNHLYIITPFKIKVNTLINLKIKI
jgi:hypothetical protein